MPLYRLLEEFGIDPNDLHRRLCHHWKRPWKNVLRGARNRWKHLMVVHVISYLYHNCIILYSCCVCMYVYIYIFIANLSVYLSIYIYTYYLHLYISEFIRDRILWNYDWIEVDHVLCLSQSVAACLHHLAPCVKTPKFYKILSCNHHIGENDLGHSMDFQGFWTSKSNRLCCQGKLVYDAATFLLRPALTKRLLQLHCPPEAERERHHLKMRKLCLITHAQAMVADWPRIAGVQCSLRHRFRWWNQFQTSDQWLCYNSRKRARYGPQALRMFCSVMFDQSTSKLLKVTVIIHEPSWTPNIQSRLLISFDAHSPLIRWSPTSKDLEETSGLLSFTASALQHWSHVERECGLPPKCPIITFATNSYSNSHGYYLILVHVSEYLILRIQLLWRRPRKRERERAFHCWGPSEEKLHQGSLKEAHSVRSLSLCEISRACYTATRCLRYLVGCNFPTSGLCDWPPAFEVVHCQESRVHDSNPISTRATLMK